MEVPDSYKYCSSTPKPVLRSGQIRLAHRYGFLFVRTFWADHGVQCFSFMWVRAWGDYLFLVGEVNGDFVVHVYQMPQPFTSSPCRTPSPPVAGASDDPSHDDYNYTSLGCMIAQFKGPTSMAVPRHHIPHISPATSSSSLSAIMFYHSVHPHSAQLLHFNFDLSPTTVRLRDMSSRDFHIGNESSAQLSQIGPRGVRAVWLEHNWETQLSRVMKLAYDRNTGTAKVGLLLPHDPELPFTPTMCHSLAFDEVSGRLCLGMYDGNVFMLDFV